MTRKCKCTLRQRLTGDGCDICNPSLALSMAYDRIDDLTADRDRLRDAVKEAYFEGFRDGEQRGNRSIIKGWEDSNTKARLKEVED